MRLDDWNWTVGVVIGSFGIRGEVKVRYETDFPDRFRNLKEVCLRSPSGDAKVFPLTGFREHKGLALLSLEGISKIEDVDAWRSAVVQVRKSDAVVLPENEYYSADIVGFEVSTASGRSLGKLERILPYPTYDLWVVGESMLPAVKQFIKEVDTGARRIVIEVPEGMLPGEEPVDAD